MQIRSQSAFSLARRAGAVALCAVALLAGNAASGTLCIETDGHVSFEPARGGACLDDDAARGAEAPATHSAVALAEARRTCGPCIDVSSPSAERVSAAQPQPRDSSALPVDSAVRPLASAGVTRRSAGPASPPAALARLRGTVLRC